MPNLQELWEKQNALRNLFDAFGLQNSNSIPPKEKAKFDLDHKIAEHKWFLAYNEYQKALDDAMFAELKRENDFFRANQDKPDVDHE